MEIILYIYFAINLFLAGYWFNENDRWESRGYAVVFSSVCLFFGGLACLIYLFSILFSPIFNWTKYEIIFWHRFKFTNYWQDILLDDDYSEKFRTKEEKLEWLVSNANNYNKQSRRHSKIVYNKYK